MSTVPERSFPDPQDASSLPNERTPWRKGSRKSFHSFLIRNGRVGQHAVDAACLFTCISQCSKIPLCVLSSFRASQCSLFIWQQSLQSILVRGRTGLHLHTR